MAAKLSSLFLLLLILTTDALAQQPETWAEFWSEIDAIVHLNSTTRIETQGGYRIANEASYVQWYTGAQLDLQLKPVLKDHLPHFDTSKENYFLFGFGYQFWRTTQDDKIPSNESRPLIEATLRFYPHSRVLLSDRNLVEFRFINGEYSTRYRNRLTVERAFLVHRLRFDPYAWGELFYATKYDSWYQTNILLECNFNSSAVGCWMPITCTTTLLTQPRIS